MSDTKVCADCRRDLPSADFSLNRAAADNKHYYCRSCTSVRNRRYYSETGRWRTYGISKADYQQMRVSQDQSCAICREEFNAEPHIDHDHFTGLVRGLLCCNCNQGVGHFRDDPARLAAAIEYLVGAP